MEQRVIGVYYDISGDGLQTMKIALVMRDGDGNLSMRAPGNDEGPAVVLTHINGVELDQLMHLIAITRRAA